MQIKNLKTSYKLLNHNKKKITLYQTKLIPYLAESNAYVNYQIRASSNKILKSTYI